MNRKTPVLALVGVWALLTALGVWLSLSIGLLPSPASLEANIVDAATTLMTALSVPIFMLVIVVQVYAIWRFRSRGEPKEDGTYQPGGKLLPIVWITVTNLLVLFLATYGAFGLVEVRAAHEHGGISAGEPLLIQVNASRFFWEFKYPDRNVTTREELVVPVGRTVRFEVRATDVLHSFWIPAFRTKIDAVPGMTTSITVNPTRVGSYADNTNFRVECSELCGGGHSTMVVPVRVLDAAGFDAWLSSQSKKQ